MTKRTRVRTGPRPLIDKAIHIEPKNVKQDRFLRAIENYQLVLGIGAAGTGKTWCAVQSAINLLVQGRVKKIVLCRANVPTGRTLGAFPGTVIDKLEPWLAPMTSVIKKRLGTNDYDAKLRAGQIEFQPLEVIRGASFENTIILVDEAQNLTYEEVKAITTRIGEGSQMVLMGDPMQKDTRDCGLVVFGSIIKNDNLPVPIVEFGVEDIVRSDIVGMLVKSFMKHEKLL